VKVINASSMYPLLLIYTVYVDRL